MFLMSKNELFRFFWQIWYDPKASHVGPLGNIVKPTGKTIFCLLNAGYTSLEPKKVLLIQTRCSVAFRKLSSFQTVRSFRESHVQQLYLFNNETQCGVFLCSKDHTIVEQWKCHSNDALRPGATSSAASHSTGFIQLLYIWQWRTCVMC